MFLPATLALRGGLAARTPDQLFNVLFFGLSSVCSIVVALSSARDIGASRSSDATKPSKAARSLQLRFLLVFWLYKMADWLQGPYFYEVYASKVINGAAMTTSSVAKFFLTGFSSTALFGAVVGGAAPPRAATRVRGSLAFALLYALSALSTRAETLPLLYAGRVAGGLGTSLLFSAPEAWLVSEHQAGAFGQAFLSQTFTLAYFGDSLNKGGAAEGNGAAEESGAADAPRPSGSIVRAVASDRRVALVGAVQALFEGAMYVFVLQWPPALKAALGPNVPFGKVFSCFMDIMAVLLACATAAMGAATFATGGALAPIACVGCYFPLIGTLRSKYLPDAYRGVIMNLFGIPLNLIVVAVFLSIGKLGLAGAFACSFSALATALVAQLLLRHTVRHDKAAA
ncbi:hypothetical protein EMIHUDRAFT_218632 [Emiliania huxleyi CCMP1516]|uniref:Molybdate-anion transporter n=2 Tax=Emiliania huxleyi TaxID=2903 RepID=A0A0D3I6N9_EMIH1|nr:hypothetical protein EMIHUDRAFT_218632 [Emiliania huxleyi CCMP1516]EOD06924.1 hypothetical protein EMIHUDRAFT_218632 [Emiliania huxleyi CCMP1516]|eukprot:XP_005759353.1 hypothetical protein EMIHUDRAFT_218632 [Emiliania huxleyi CCMP1516]